MVAPAEDFDRSALIGLIDELAELRDEMVQAEHDRASAIARVHPRHRRSAANLVHYLVLRRHDVRELQDALTPLGLSSLGRAEAHVLASVDAVLATLACLAGAELDLRPCDAVGFAEGARLLDVNTEALLGPAPADRATRIMVTLPSEAADDPDLVARMAAAGMDLARINCAHDDRQAWARMAAHARAAARNGPLKVLMDLGGPKLRTGALAPGPQVRRVRPVRDPYGRAVSPGRAWLIADGAPAVGGIAIPIVDPTWLARRAIGDHVNLIDTRGARRTLDVVALGRAAVAVEVWDTTYFGTRTRLRAETAAGADETTVGELPAVDQALVLEVGDRLLVVADTSTAPVHDPGAGGPARIACTLPEAFTSVSSGDRILFDDGKIGGVVSAVREGELEVEITRARRGGTRLRGGKGINLPDSDLAIAAITDQDVADLAVAARFADGVNASFVRLGVSI